MIVKLAQNPIDPTERKQLVDFYSDLIQGLRINTKAVTVVPYAAQWDFRVTAPGAGVANDSYFDIGNLAQGNILAANLPTYLLNSVYHGDLKLVTFFDQVTGAANILDSYNELVNGQIGQQTLWRFKQRHMAVGAVDVSINSPEAPGGFVDQFDNVTFSLLHKVVNIQGVGTTAREASVWIFNGVRIYF